MEVKLYKKWGLIELKRKKCILVVGEIVYIYLRVRVR